MLNFKTGGLLFPSYYNWFALWNFKLQIYVDRYIMFVQEMINYANLIMGFHKDLNNKHNHKNATKHTSVDASSVDQHLLTKNQTCWQSFALAHLLTTDKQQDVRKWQQKQRQQICGLKHCAKSSSDNASA